MRSEGGVFARMRSTWMLRRILDASGAGASRDAEAAWAEHRFGDVGAAGTSRDSGDEGAEEVFGDTGVAGKRHDAQAARRRRGRRRSPLALDASIVETLRAVGTSLPSSDREALYRESLAAAVEKARSRLSENLGSAGTAGTPAGIEAASRDWHESRLDPEQYRRERRGEAAHEGTAETTPEKPGEAAAPRRRVLTIPRAAAACFVILVVLAVMGFASTYAMPGNPFYSVKRTVESARLFFTPSGEKEANLLIANAEKRLGELEYAGDRQMTGWYASLAVDASRDILKALTLSRDLPEDKCAAIRSRAFDLMRRLESLLFATLEDIPRERSEELKQDVGDIREELWPEGVPPDWVDPWAHPQDREIPVDPRDRETPLDRVPPLPPVEPVPPVTPGEPSPPVDPSAPVESPRDMGN